jgi:hypothetical protein
MTVRGVPEAGEDEVAAKHDGKHARANMWVTHQNLARAKGGRPHYQYKEKAARVAKAPPAAAPSEAAPATAAPVDPDAATPPSDE